VSVAKDARLEEGVERAQAAQKQFEERGGNVADPSGPLYQWVALQEIEHRLRQQFEAGDRMALFAAIRKCANHDVIMPAWVSTGFIQGYDRVLRCESSSWDEVFGLPYGTRKKSQLVGMKRRRDLRFEAYFAVRAMQKGGHTICVDTFRIVAEKLGSNAAEVGKLYGFVNRMYKASYQNKART
jgi:hypothetical protein